MGLNKTPLSGINESAAYFKASDVQDSTLTLTIKSVESEIIGQEETEKLVVKFEESDKGLVLNKTNWRIIESVTGKSNSDDWAGFKITLYQTEIIWQGKEMPCIRVMQTLRFASDF